MKRVTKAQIKKIVDDYANVFQGHGWTRTQVDEYGRLCGPVYQGVFFERPSSGYRPIGFVRILAIPDVPGRLELPQHFDHRSLDIRSHKRECPKVAAALKEQIRPPIDRPLSAEVVLDLYEELINPDHRSSVYSLAALNAYLGHKERALHWIRRYRATMPEDLSTAADFVIAALRFLDQLERWMHEGVAKDRLDAVIRQEREKMGLSPTPSS